MAANYNKVWARMWMLHQFAHEYGHHVQHLTGILDAKNNMRYEAPTQAAAAGADPTPGAPGLLLQ